MLEEADCSVDHSSPLVAVSADPLQDPLVCSDPCARDDGGFLAAAPHSPEPCPAPPSARPKGDDILITSFEKQGEGMNAFVLYHVTGKVRGAKVQVSRRFSEFVWLHERLSENHSGVIVPPLPEKTVGTTKMLDPFNLRLLEYRMQALQRFLNRIAVHPILGQSTFLQTFLTATQQEMEESKKQSSSGIWSSSSLSSWLGSVTKLSYGGTIEVEDNFTHKSAYINELYMRTLNAALAAEELVARHEDTLTCLSKTAQCYHELASTEAVAERSAQTLLGMQNAPPVSSRYFAFSNALDLGSQVMGRQIDDELHKFVYILKDNVQCLSAVKDMLEGRMKKVAEWQEAERAANSGKAQLGSALKEKAAQLLEITSNIERQCIAELETFDRTKAKEMEQCIDNFLSMQVEYHRKLSGMYADALNSIREKRRLSGYCL